MAKWTKPVALRALEWFATARDMTVFTNVPVVRPDWRGWDSSFPRRVLHVAVGGLGDGRVRPFVEDDFVDALASGRSVHPLNAWGFADRTVFGHLATHNAYLAKSWPSECSVEPVALVAPGQGGTNVAPAYHAVGYRIEEIPGDPSPSRRRGGGPGGRNDPWDAPRSGEDRLLHDLWKARSGRGWCLAEVPTGFTSKTSEGTARLVDAVVVDWPSPRHSKGQQHLDELADAVARAETVELIEAKSKLNTDVVGQLLCGAHLFAQSWPGAGRLALTACVGTDADKAVRWFCANRGIRVEVPQAS